MKVLFEACDADGDGRLSSAEMHRLAVFSGFEGSSEEWDEEYRFLCEERGCEPETGIPEILCMELIDDESDSCCCITDDELREIHETLKVDTAAQSGAAKKVNEAPQADTLLAESPREPQVVDTTVAEGSSHEGEIRQKVREDVAAQSQVVPEVCEAAEADTLLEEPPYPSQVDKQINKANAVAYTEAALSSLLPRAVLKKD